MTSKLPCADRPTLSGERIIFVFGTLELGGAERQALLLAQYLKEVENAAVEVWGFLGPGRATELCEQYGIPWRVVPLYWGRWYLRRYMDLLRFAWTLRKSRPSIVLPYTMQPNVVCGLIWRWSGARLCVWNQRDEGVQRLGHASEVRAARQVSTFVANSHGGAQFLAQELGVNPDLIKVIPNGVVLVKPELDRANWRVQLGLTENCFAVCMVGNLHGNKDHATLLQAWRLVVEEMDKLGRSSVLLLAGRKDDSKPLEMLCRSLNIEGSVKFLGNVKDIAGLLQAVDLGVLSSRSEGCPNGVLECMAAGLAVAGTDIPGIRDVICPGGHAFLAPPGGAEALADCIIKLALDPELRAKLGRANRAHVEKEFNPQKMCEEMVKLLSPGNKLWSKAMIEA
jgi:glycosyltransferase involved in cell wall biosynthesis